MKTILKISLLSFLMLSLTSCALSNSTKQINYESRLQVDEKLSSSKPVNVEDMKDDRGYDDPTVIFYKKNLYNQTMSGAYTAEKPVNEILTQAIKDGFKLKNINLSSENSGYTLKSNLQKIDYEAISGFTSVDLIPQITVKFQLVNMEGQTVWTDIITGKAKTRGAKFEKFLPPAIDNLVEKLIQNPEFLQVISNN